MKKTLNLECCELGSDISDRYNLHENNYLARIIYDPDLASKRMEEAQRAFEAKQAEVQAQNAEIQERNKAAEAKCARKKSDLISSFIFAWLTLSFLIGCMLGIKSFGGWLFVFVIIAVIEFVIIMVVTAEFEIWPEYIPEETLDCSESIEDFYAIHEKFMKWWKEDFCVLKMSFWCYYYDYTISLEVADEKDEIHKGTFEIPKKNAPQFIVKRNQNGIEFDLINNRIIVPYVAS